MGNKNRGKSRKTITGKKNENDHQKAKSSQNSKSSSSSGKIKRSGVKTNSNASNAKKTVRKESRDNELTNAEYFMFVPTGYRPQKTRTSNLKVVPEISLINMDHYTQVVSPKSAKSKQPPGFEGNPVKLYGINWYGNTDEVLRTDQTVLSRTKTLDKTDCTIKTDQSMERSEYVTRMIEHDNSEMSEATFKQIQVTFLECLRNTLKESGWKTAFERKEDDYALGYLEGILNVCSKEQRKTLIETGGNISPLFMAYESSNVKVLRYFLECCDVQIKCPDKCLLMSAIMDGNIDMSKLLITTDKKVPCPVDGHATPLVVACGGYPIDFEWHEVTVEEKWKGFPDDRPYSYEFYRSFVEKYKNHKGNSELVQLLIDQGAMSGSVNPSTVFKCFKVCIDTGNFDIMKLLIHNGNSVDQYTNVSGCTPLGYAIQKGNLKAVKLLMTNGADINNTKVLVNTRLSKKEKSDQKDDNNDPKNTSSSVQPSDRKLRSMKSPRQNKDVNNKSKPKAYKTKTNKRRAGDGKEKKKRKLVESEEKSESGLVFVHPVVFTVANQYYDLFYYLLNSDIVPYGEKLNALDLFGAKIAMKSMICVGHRVEMVKKEQKAAFDIWESTSSLRLFKGIEKEHTAEPRHFLMNYTEITGRHSITNSMPLSETLIQAYLTHERVIGYNLRFTLPSVKLVVECYDKNGWHFHYIEFLADYLKRAFVDSNKNSKEYEDAICLLKQIVISEVKLIYMGLSIHYYEDLKAVCEAVYASGFIVPTKATPVKGFPCSVLDCLLLMIKLLVVAVFTDNSDDATPENVRDLVRYVRPMLHMDPRCPHLESLLHKAVKLQYDHSAWQDPTILYYEEIPRFSTPLVVDFLLSCGVNLAAHDREKNTVFHTFLKDFVKHPYNVEEHIEVGNMLLSNGLLTDTENMYGETPDTLCSATKIRFSGPFHKKF